jgi:hypothetical protein
MCSTAAAGVAAVSAAGAGAEGPHAPVQATAAIAASAHVRARRADVRFVTCLSTSTSLSQGWL